MKVRRSIVSADFVKLPISIYGFSALSLCWLGCGEDSEQRYAGLSVAHVETADGFGYRLRYRDPPWEYVDDDPLVAGTRNEVQIGARMAKVDANSTTVLEIERVSLVRRNDGFTYPKYRVEASVLTCDIPIATGDTCAERIAIEDDLARRETDETGFFSPSPRESLNDFKQRYYELLSKNLETNRYARIAYYETDHPRRYVRLAMEANPALDETEVTRMFNAFEVVMSARAGSTMDAGLESAEGGL